jgi:hypothetical protein
MANDGNDFFVSEDSENEEDIRGVDSTIFDGTIVSDADWTTETIVSQLKKGNILLNPAFQRRDAWTDVRKSRFIESLFLGLPIPQIVLAESQTSKGKFIVIDGKQRLISLLRFALDDENPLKLRDLEIRSDLNGKTLNQLISDPSSEDDVSGFENQTVRTTVIRGWKNEAVLYLIFYRLNSGSVSLSPQELRHVLHPGPFIDFAFSFSEQSQSLIDLLGKNGKPDFRMRDVELVIRYFAFSIYFEKYAGDLKQFLDNTTLLLNQLWPQDEADLVSHAQLLDDAINITQEIFSKDAFHKWTSKGYERRFNRAVFDCMVFYFSKPELMDAILKHKDEIRDEFVRLCTDDFKFIKSLETTTKSTTATFTRLFTWGNSLERILGVTIPELGVFRSRLG